MAIGPGEGVRYVLRSWVPGITCVVATVGVAAAWIPIRDRISNVNVALLLVAAVATTGWFGPRTVVVVSAVAAALAFDALDTAPYGTLAIARSQDLITTVVLALVGLAGAELALRFRRSRNASTREGFSCVQKTASLIALGEETATVVGNIGDEIRRLLQLRDCRFEAGEPPAGMRVVGRDGQVHVLVEAGSGTSEAFSGLPADEVALPVLAMGRSIGFFRLSRHPGAVFARDSLAVAVTLADQAGAALSAFEPVSPGTSDSSRPVASGHLRLVT